MSDVGERVPVHGAEQTSTVKRLSTIPARCSQWSGYLLLVLMSTLIVARPMLPGEDPGMLIPLTDTSGPLLVLLWLVALVLWGLKLLCSRGATWRVGWVELGLLGVIVAHFLSANIAASYRHPAWLVCWEWAALGVAFFLVRQATANRRLLLATVLATGTTVATYGIYQSQVEFAEIRRELDQPNRISQNLKTFGVDASAHVGEALRERVQKGHVFSTFAHPNSFAGYLVLLFPLVIGAAWAARKDRSAASGAGVERTHDAGMTLGAQSLLFGIVIAVFAAALWLTHSRGGLLAAASIGLAALGWWSRQWLTWRWRCAIAGAVLLLVAGWFTSGRELPGLFGKEPEAVRLRMEYWTATWAMIVDHPWLGVGPGNFPRYYSSYMSLVPRASEVIRDPHQFALELWATTGVLGLAALLFALGAFVGQSVRFVFAMSKGGCTTSSNGEPERPVWLHYVGGGMGLLITIVFADDFDPVRIGLQALVWFASFWFFQRVLWSGNWIVVASLAGAAGLLLGLLVAGGIGSPAVAQPMWVVIGLGLSGIPGRDRSIRFWPLRFIALVLALLLAVWYFDSVFRPVVVAHKYLARAAELRKSSASRARNSRIGEALQAACAANPGDSRPRMQMAVWQWEHGDGATWRERTSQALAWLEQARQLDPRNHQMVFNFFQADLELAQLVDAERLQLIARRDRQMEDRFDAQALTLLEQEREQYLDRALGRIGELVQLNPRVAARVHLDLADAFSAMKDSRARAHARIAWQAHQDAQSPAYRLTPAQLQQLEQLRGP